MRLGVLRRPRDRRLQIVESLTLDAQRRLVLVRLDHEERLILLGEDASPRLRRSTSLDALVTPQSPPFFVWHTAEDPYVPPEHTYRLASALAASQVPHEVHVFAHGPHSLGLAKDAGEAAIWTTLASAWIREQVV